MAYYLKVSKPSYFLLPAGTIGGSTHVDFWKADRTAVRPISLEDSIVNVYKKETRGKRRGRRNVERRGVEVVVG